MEEKDICPKCCLNNDALFNKLVEKIVDKVVSKLDKIRVAANDRNCVLRRRVAR